MIKKSIIFTICMLLMTPAILQSLEFCDPSHCNHEGQCFIEDDLKTCKCIGDNYFRGPRCTDIVDNCLSMPCQNGGQCRNLVGQFMCQHCQHGYGGLWCDVEIEGVFENIALYFNHYGHYSKSQNFLIIVEKLGSIPFSAELLADNYVIDSFETTDLQNYQTQWTYSGDLITIIENKGIRYHNDLPFKKGYYHAAKETFWELDLMKLTLRVYDTETASKMFYYQNYDLLVMNLGESCVPMSKFLHGSDPMDPLLVDIARFNNFEPVVLNRCFRNATILFEWRVFNTIGNKMLYNFGTTLIPRLKVAPYKLWFNYHGEVMSSYSMVVTTIEQTYRINATHEARSFLLILPKPVQATIKGGPHREISNKQPHILDGSSSRDFALAPLAKQDLVYRWDCVSMDDAQNRFCRPNISKRRIFKIAENLLKLKAKYNFTLVVQSKVNVFISDKTQQHVLVSEIRQLFLNIKCVRNCLRNQFNIDNTIHLVVQCDFNGRECPRNAEFYWTINGMETGRSRRCIYRPKELESELMFTVEVLKNGLSGKASMQLTRNLPPTGGSCSIEPKSGVAFETKFHIKCEDYEDSDSPLSYQYMAGDFPLERINDAAASIMLPQCQLVAIVICDQLDACIATHLVVQVSALSKPPSLRVFLSAGKSNINELISGGYNLDSMILIKSLLKYMNTEGSALEVVKHLDNLTPLTLLEFEQWLNICSDFSKNLLPLNNRKTLALNEFLRKLSDGLQIIIDDQEILDMQTNCFEQSLTQIGAIMKDFAKPWETITETHTLNAQMVKATDPLAEHYTQLPDFDIFILEKITNWLETSRELHRCFDLLSLQATYIYYPEETPFSIEDEQFKMKMYAMDETTAQQSFGLELSQDVIKDLQKQLQSKTIVFQMALMKSNPFWWYPNDRPLSANIFYLSAFSLKSPPHRQAQLSKLFTAKFHLEESEMLTSRPEIEGVIKDHLHMPVFALQLPSNAAVIVELLETQMDVLIEIGIGQKPRSFQVRHSQQIFTKNNASSPQKYFAINGDSETLVAYIAVLATKHVKVFPLHFQFYLTTIECLYWNWNLKDPQWSSKGCRPKLNLNLSQELQCECDHLSTFAAKNYPTPVDEDLGDCTLLESLHLNVGMVTIYIVIFVIFTGILAYNFHRSQNTDNILMSDANNDDCDLEVRIYTGSHWNSTSSANIQLRFISQRGPYSVTIFQDPQKPQLQRNSMCILRLSSSNVILPLKLTISNDQSGRYPSWYCHEIVVINLLTKQFQLFTINQWISKQPLELMSSNSNERTLKQRFVKNLENFYNNWFQFQPIFGPSLYTDTCCFQRSCIWVSQIMVSLCIVACYHGPTTMTTYEAERELYYSLNFSITEVLLLPLVCFLSSIFIKWSFAYFCK